MRITPIVDKLERDRPLFHDDIDHCLTSWNTNLHLLRFVEGWLKPRMRTLETGSGYSTVVFIAKGCFHTCITPSELEIDRIVTYCRENNISIDQSRFINKNSTDCLPFIQHEEIDLMFIDGAHRFPYPIIDWFYGSRLIKDGGLVIVDDTDIVSCFILRKFLESDTYWEQVLNENTYAVFKKMGECNYPNDWVGQIFSRNKIETEKDFIKIFFSQYDLDRENSIYNQFTQTGKSQFLEENSVTSNQDLTGCSRVDINTQLVSNGTNQKDIVQMSVIICTYNRAALLDLTLKSLISQTLDNRNFEVIIVDDGSSDDTRLIVDSYVEKLPIKYFYQKNSGLASARNHGIYASQGEIILFLDDDDFATHTLLEKHIETHRVYPQENYAVLNYTTWAPNLIVTPLMHYITEVGCFLFSYPFIKNGEILDYTYFWGGRSSCKRSFLINHGVFNPVFHFGCEDIELGYRLSKHGLKVVYNADAISYMARPVTFDEFCQRLMKQGRSNYIFSRLHDETEVVKWAEISEAEIMWGKIEPFYEAKIRSARELDKIANFKLQHHLDIDDSTKRLLFKSYFWAFKASKYKGIILAKEELKNH